MGRHMGGAAWTAQATSRRELLHCLALAAVLPASARGQQAMQMARIGWIGALPGESPIVKELLDAFRQGMRELGRVEGQHFVLEYRSAEGKLDRQAQLAAELIQLKVDVIVAGNTAAARVAQQLTATIPIVCPNLGDPMGEGLVESLARPGRNVTGYSILAPELVPKQLALLKEAVPGISRVTGLWQPMLLSESTGRDMLEKAEAAARQIGVGLELVPVENAADVDDVLARMKSVGSDGLLVLPSPLSLSERGRLMDAVTRHALPSIGWIKEFARAGGLLSYGASFRDQYLRSASYVDRILRGARPAELPIQQPTTFELVINLRAAKALSVNIPPTLLGLADEVIE